MPPFSLNYPISVAILYFGGSAEDLQDTVITVSQMQEALKRRGHVVRVMEVNKKNWRQAVRIPGQVVFNLVEDLTWELYIKVGEALERMGRAQVGHDLKLFKYATKKAALKRKMTRLGISTPAYRVLNRRSRPENIRGLEYPVIVKPSGQHAGIGISQDSVVIDEQELKARVQFVMKHYPGEVLVEEYIEGREIHVTVLGNRSHVVCLPYAELHFKGEFADNWNIYTYEAKWVKESWEYWNVPVRVADNLHPWLDKKIERLATTAYKKLGCRDIARFDIRLDDKDRPFIVDVNANPSLCYDELDATWVSAKALGWKYEDLIEKIVAIAYKRTYHSLPDRLRERQLLLANPR